MIVFLVLMLMLMLMRKWEQHKTNKWVCSSAYAYAYVAGVLTLYLLNMLMLCLCLCLCSSENQSPMVNMILCTHLGSENTWKTPALTVTAYLGVSSGRLRKISRKHIQWTAAPNNTMGSLPNLLLLLPKIPKRRPPVRKQHGIVLHLGRLCN